MRRRALCGLGLSLLLLPLLLQGCSGGGGTPDTVAPPASPPTSERVFTTLGVTFSGPGSTVTVGQQTFVYATTLDQFGVGMATPSGVTWSTASQAVARVSTDGFVTGVAPGQTQVIASYGGKQGQATVTVVPAPVASFQLQNIVSWGGRTCGQSAGGTTYCWEPVQYTVRTVPGAPAFQEMSTGPYHTCGITAAGNAYCWGDNGLGQLGDGTQTSRATPVPVTGGLTFMRVAVGWDYSCGLTTSGAAYCWGTAGAWGTSQYNVLTPTAVLGGVVLRSLSAGYGHICGLTAAGAAFCWGNNASGQLGDGTRISRTRPVAVVSGMTFSTVDAGEGSQTCGLTLAGAAYCWGSNTAGKLGDGTTVDRLSPTPVSSAQLFQTLTTGGSGTCGLTGGGTAYCWGDNGSGEVGDGSKAARFTPVPVSGGLTFVSLAAGGAQTCGIRIGGTVYCWGAGGWPASWGSTPTLITP